MMVIRRFHIATSFLFAFVAQGCAAAPQATHRSASAYSVTAIESFGHESLPVSGRYYVLFAESDDIASNPEAMIADLEKKGVPAIHVWYRPARKDCTPAGGLRSALTDYRAVFIVHMINRHEGLRELGFREVAGQPLIVCPYNMLKYTRQQ